MNRPNGRGMMPAVKSKRGIVGVLKELFRYSSSLKLPMAVAMLLAVTGAILTIIGPDKLSQITNLISDSLLGDIDMEAIASVGIFLLLLYA